VVLASVSGQQSNSVVSASHPPIPACVHVCNMGEGKTTVLASCLRIAVMSAFNTFIYICSQKTLKWERYIYSTAL